MLRVLWGITGTLLLIALLLIAAACTPAAQPTPVAAPTKPAAAPAATKPAEAQATAKPAASPAAAKPAATAAPAAKPAASGRPAASADWKAEWDKVLAAAKKEGKVVVTGDRGIGWREATMEFAKAYPDIKLDFISMSARDFAPKVLAEREGGLYLWDVYLGGATTMHSALVPNKVLDPIQTALILPEVLDDKNWNLGFNAGFLDKGGQYVYQFISYLTFLALVDRDIAPVEELRTVDDLLNPKWKGKIAWEDPRQAGSGAGFATHLLIAKGEDWLRRLLAHDIVALTDTRMLVEGLARGQYAAAIGTRPDEEKELRDLGLLQTVEPLDPGSIDSSRATGGSGNLGLINRAPNPNAAKVFINWLLSKEGQEIYVKYTGTNTRRLGIEGPAYTAPKPGVKYIDVHREEYLPMNDRARSIAKEIIK